MLTEDEPRRCWARPESRRGRFRRARCACRGREAWAVSSRRPRRGHGRPGVVDRLKELAAKLHAAAALIDPIARGGLSRAGTERFGGWANSCAATVNRR